MDCLSCHPKHPKHVGQVSAYWKILATRTGIIFGQLGFGAGSLPVGSPWIVKQAAFIVHLILSWVWYECQRWLWSCHECERQNLLEGGSTHNCWAYMTLSGDLHFINKVCCRWDKHLRWSSGGVMVIKLIERNRERKRIVNLQRANLPLGSCDNWQSSYIGIWTQLLILPSTSIL